MTLPASGSMTWAQIQSEFELPTPISTANMYRGGGYVPSTNAANSGIPTSGALTVPTHFYSANGTVAIIATNTFILRTNPSGMAFAGYFAYSDGRVYKDQDNTGGVYFQDWNDAILRPNDYQIYCSATGDTAHLTGSTRNAWLALSSTRGWTLTANTNGDNWSVTLTISFRKGTGATLKTITVVLRAQYGLGIYGLGI